MKKTPNIGGGSGGTSNWGGGVPLRGSEVEEI